MKLTRHMKLTILPMSIFHNLIILLIEAFKIKMLVFSIALNNILVYVGSAVENVVVSVQKYFCLKCNFSTAIQTCSNGGRVVHCGRGPLNYAYD